MLRQNTASLQKHNSFSRTAMKLEHNYNFKTKNKNENLVLSFRNEE